jgi:hypothetical protein
MDNRYCLHCQSNHCSTSLNVICDHCYKHIPRSYTIPSDMLYVNTTYLKDLTTCVTKRMVTSLEIYTYTPPGTPSVHTLLCAFLGCNSSSIEIITRNVMYYVLFDGVSFNLELLDNFYRFVELVLSDYLTFMRIDYDDYSNEELILDDIKAVFTKEFIQITGVEPRRLLYIIYPKARVVSFSWDNYVYINANMREKFENRIKDLILPTR